ncbi:hypothetical protein VZT92_016941 [Zoarces viviparus]|uniref:Interferon-induced very large GTPase 1-like n=1 Tax=Zoarces viviparus TaxID=48416 RepID=A0AAW1EQU4_ZOAVI
MAESVPTMDNSDEEDYYDAPDRCPELYCEEGENTPPPSQSDYVPPPGEVSVLNATSKSMQTVFTEPNPPVQITVDQVSSESLSLCWDPPAGEVESYIVTCCHEGDIVQESTDTNKLTLSNLKPGVCYTLEVSTRFTNGRISKPAVTSARTKTHLESLLEDLGLEQLYPEKLSLSTILQIDDKTITDEPAKCNSDLPWYFLKKLMMLSDLMSPKSKILVVTVLGVQSTGKSTLLNTMFGVQFAVSSGRCTRGAFMLLIRINEDVKKVLNCDFMVIIDTEGLKSPELAQLDNSHEHDNELATLVVGLSDITIINIAMENSTDMKDILQIVVHAFLRMSEVGKKPKCQFVHQNVSDVSAHDKNLRDRKLLLQQLNEMTQAAAKMEKKEENKSFTDVMEYSPDTGNCYIPGLWNGNPPMAPVNAGYSEAVYELKKNIIQMLGSCESSANNILEFTEWMKSLWNAVKHENFIFSFRNSLVADAYMSLCTEFNKWEWEFKKEMYTDGHFCCAATNDEYHPFKDYAAIFPDWRIVPDVSLQASDYWKYILAKFNQQFAKAFTAEPADIPATWKRITRKQAEESIKVSFNIK